MPSATPALPTAIRDPARELQDLRGELDGLDDALHDLLMRRARVVGEIAGLGAKGRVPLRPGREAAIVRRLLARHAGPFPAASLVRLWRELICGMTAVQRPLRIAVCDGAAGGGAAGGGQFLAAAREHFGALVPLHQHSTPAQALNEVGSGQAVAAVLPVPREDEAAREAWWTALLHQDATGPRAKGTSRDLSRLHVVARLPFWAPRPEGAPGAQAMVVTAADPDASGHDRSLLGLELALDVSRARLGTALAAAGFAAGPVILRRDPGADVAYALVDVEGFVDDGDARLGALGSVLRRPVRMGAYAVPVGVAA